LRWRIFPAADDFYAADALKGEGYKMHGNAAIYAILHEARLREGGWGKAHRGAPDSGRSGECASVSDTSPLRRARDSERGPDVMPSNTCSQAFGPNDRSSVRGAISPARSSASRIALSATASWGLAVQGEAK
jgi:hypothetical protein